MILRIPMCRKFRPDQRGATAIEYGLIAGLIALGIVGSLVGTRGSLNATYDSIATGVNPPTVQYLPASAITSKWSSKAVSSITSTPITTGSGQTVYKRVYQFADGSTVIYNPPFDNKSGHFYGSVFMTDTAVNPNLTVIALPQGDNGLGAPNPYFISRLYGASGTAEAGNIIQSDQFNLNQNFTGTTTDTVYYYTNGKSTSTTTKTVSQATYAPYFNDTKYFDSVQ